MMSNHDTKRLKMAQALRSAFHAEVLEDTPTSEEVSQILVDNGEDPEAVARQYRELIAEKIRAAKKERMLGLRRQSTQSVGFALRGVISTKAAPLPSIETMRARIATLSTTPEFDKSTLAIAYRNGTKQSDGDISSLYQDLLDLGVIKDDPEN
jgi:hypothetical protein